MTDQKAPIHWIPIIIPALTSLMVMYFGFKLQDKKDHDMELLNEVKEIKTTINKTAIIFGQIQVEIKHIKEGQEKLERRIEKIEEKITEPLKHKVVFLNDNQTPMEWVIDVLTNIFNHSKETAEKINGADAMIFQTEKQLKEFGDKLSADKKQPIEDALSELKTAHESKDLAQIDAAMEKINEAWKAASEEMYAAQQQAGANGAANAEDTTSDSNQGDNVEDVDFEEVK